MRAPLLLALAACGGAPTPQPASLAPRSGSCANYDDRPKGTQDDYVPPTLAGFTIAAPVTCEGDHGAYIRIERSSGARKLGIGRAQGGGFAEGCTSEPKSDDDCPVLNWGVPMMAANQALAARGIMVNGIGGGPCADIQGDYAAWNMSIGVTSWAQAATALQVVADEMNRYDVAGYLGVAVKGVQCAELL